MDIKKGQRVWIKTCVYGIIETEITVVGLKYVTVKLWKLKFNRDTFKEVGCFGSPSILILDLEEYKKKREIEQIRYKSQPYNFSNSSSSISEKFIKFC